MSRPNRQRLMRLINENPLDSAFWFVRRLNALSFLAPKRVEASILFIDMTHSVWSKIDDPLVWQENIYTIHSRSRKIIECCKGHVSKTIGDATMAYFLDPYHHENAVLAATALMQTFHLLKEYFEPDIDSTLWRFQITIGVASGPVYFLYRRDPFGFATDMAARLQSACKPGEAVFSQSTIEAIRDTPLFSEIQSFLCEPEEIPIKPFGNAPIRRLKIPV